VGIGARKDLERRQRRWADAAGIAYDARGYVREHDTNLFQPLQGATRADFERGSELVPGRSTPARCWSLLSSAALVANVFDHWRNRDTTPLLAALGLPTDSAAELTFEVPLPTGLAGDPPTTDVALRWPSGRLAIIESKFAEWLVRRPRHKAQFKTKYFPPDVAVWRTTGRPRCQALADAIQAGHERYRFLHAAQLLKHALGLAASGRDEAILMYLYFDWPSREADAHRAELERFAVAVRGELDFRVLTYQALFAALVVPPTVTDYRAYLERRYFG